MRSVRLASFVFAATLLGACGDACPAPDPVRGGGIGGAFEGRTTILVVDADGAPIEGAEVWAGDGATATRIGTTSAVGTVCTSETSTTYTAVANGRAVTIASASGAVVTIRFVDEIAPSAIVTATFPEWSALPLDGDYLVARAGFTLTPAIDAEENLIAQPTDAVLDCERSDASGECTVRIATRTGSLRVFLAIASGFDDAATPADRTDDRLEPVGIALTELADLEAGEAIDATLVLESDVVPVEIVQGEAPPIGLDAVVGVPGARTSSDGVVIWPASLGARSLIPRTIGGAAATHWVIGDARSALASSRAILRDATFGADPVRTPALPAPPDVAVSGGRVVVSPSADTADAFADTVRVDVIDEAGSVVWTGYLFDEGAAGVLSPPHGLEMPSAGVVRASVIRRAQVEGEIISIAAMEETWSQRASRSIAFSGCPWLACR